MSTFVQTFLRLCVKSPEQDSSISSQMRTNYTEKDSKDVGIHSSEPFDALGNQIISEYMTKDIWNKALRQLQRHDQCTGRREKRKRERIQGKISCKTNIKLKERNNNVNLYIPKHKFSVSQQFPETTINEQENLCSHLTEPVFNLFVFLAREGVKINGLFRRPGNIADMKNILLNLSKDIPVNWGDYNIYTVANVAKRFLICLPHGIFGLHGESLLLRTARMRCPSLYENTELIASNFSKSSITPEDRMRLETFCNVLNTLSPTKKELALMTFGILFNMVENVNSANIIDNSMPMETDESSKENSNSEIRVNPEKLTIAEGIAKSVAGSLFHSCAHAVSEVDSATIIITSLLLNFHHLPKELIAIYEDAVSGKTQPTKQENMPIKDSDSVSNEPLNGHQKMRENLRIYAERLLCLSNNQDSKMKKNQSRHYLVSTNKRRPLICGTKSGGKSSFSSYTKASFELSSDARDSSVSNFLNQMNLQQNNNSAPEKSEKSTQTSILKISKQNSQNDSFESKTRQRPVHISSVNWHESVDEAESSAILINFATPVQLKSRPSLVRRHSRYKSIQRRQMATLALKSAWFLAEQPIPVICIPDHSFEVKHSRQSSERSASFHNSGKSNQFDNDGDKLSTISLIDMNEHDREYTNNQLECSIHLTASAIEMMMYSTDDVSSANYNGVMCSSLTGWIDYNTHFIHSLDNQLNKNDQDEKFNAFLQPCSSLLSLQSAPDKFDNTSDLFIDFIGFNVIRPYTWPSTFEKGFIGDSFRGHISTTDTEEN